MKTTEEKEREGEREGGTTRKREQGEELGVQQKGENPSVPPSVSVERNTAASSSPPPGGVKKTTYKKRGEAVDSWIRVWSQLGEKALFSLEIDQAKKNAVKARKKLAADTKGMKKKKIHMPTHA